MRSYAKSGTVEAIRAAGGEVYAVTSEPQALADRARREWDLPFECVGDPHQEISAVCNERGWLEIFVNRRLGFLERSAADYGKDAPQHPKGYFQPGVLALSGEGRVLYRWRSVPTHKNVGGALERPTPEHVWGRVEEALAAGPGAGDAAHDDAPALDSRGFPWPIFAALLVANGSFLRPRGFIRPELIPWAMAKLVGFVGAWALAFWALPTLPVAVALGAWVAYIAPKVRWVGLEFQDATR